MDDQANETSGTVVGIDGEYAIVRVEAGGCGRCHEEGGCGGNPLHRLSGPASRDFRVINEVQARIGQCVTLVIPAGAIRRSATAAYLWPLAALIGGALAGSTLAGEAGALAGAALGMVAGWLIFRRAGQRHAGDTAMAARIRG